VDWFGAWLNTIVCGLNIVLVEHRVAPLAILAQFSQDGFRKHPGLISRKCRRKLALLSVHEETPSTLVKWM
jgi:hypothetical protein